MSDLLMVLVWALRIVYYSSPSLVILTTLEVSRPWIHTVGRVRGEHFTGSQRVPRAWEGSTAIIIYSAINVF